MIKAIITDIEGTTSSLAFVKETLLPYARKHIAEYIRAHENDPLVQQAFAEIRQITGSGLTTEQIIQTLVQWIDEDKKITPLKSIQGLVWDNGYHQGHFKGHIYEDEVNNLRKWETRGIRIYVYSSGSVHAQKLLFGNTQYGDLNPIFSGYFDTRIGAKTATETYQIISTSITVDPKNCLFLSDIKQELDAAHDAGMKTIWLVRSGKPNADSAHKQAVDFDAIQLSDF